MKLATYQSSNAPDNRRWIAYIVGNPNRPAKSKLEHGETNDPMGYLPIKFVGATEQEVSAKADEWWRTGERKRQERAANRKAAIEKANKTKAAKAVS